MEARRHAGPPSPLRGDLGLTTPAASPPTAGDLAHAAAVAASIAAWWPSSQVRAERDRFAWRSARDPYAVLVAEVMLAQTRAERVGRHYEAFVERFPSPSALSGAPLSEVLTTWAGLGYPRRARHLREAARLLVDRHGGEVPDDLDALRSLPGVGEYIARAVLAFAFDRPVMPLDTNIGRVLARAVAGRPLAAAAARQLADGLVATELAGRDQALAVMDLGAVLCRARLPACDRCPLGGPTPLCRYRASGVADDPAVSSHGVSRRQAPFAGSDREGRGRLLRAAALGPVLPDGLPAACGWPAEVARAERVADGLVADGLLTRDDSGAFRLPE